MKNITTSVLGFEVPVTDVPENLQEMITAAGGEEAALQGWLNYIRFHKTNTEARSEVADRVEKITGIARSSKMVKAPTKADPNNEREEWDESEADYVKRALAEHGDGASLTPQILDGLSIKFSAQGAARVGGPKKVAQVYTKAAQQLMEDATKLAKAVTLLEGKNPGVQIATDDQGKVVLESLAAALKVNKERTDRESNAALGLVE